MKVDSLFMEYEQQLSVFLAVRGTDKSKLECRFNHSFAFTEMQNVSTSRTRDKFRQCSSERRGEK